MLRRLIGRVTPRPVGNSQRVRQLVALAEEFSGSTSTPEQLEKVAAFRRKHMLSEIEYGNVVDALSTDFATMTYLNKNAENILERKLRESGIVTSHMGALGKF